MKTERQKLHFMEKKNNKKPASFEQYSAKDDFSTRSFPTLLAKTTTATVYTKTNGSKKPFIDSFWKTL
jgi:hypothetical protein